MRVFSRFRRLFALGVLAAVPLQAFAQETPIAGGGNFGLGLEVGDPGTWGVVGKLWIDKKNAFQPAVKLGGGVATLQLDYLWHTFDIIRPRQGLVPFYFGVGGDVVIQNSVAFGARGVGGIAYHFDRVEVPVDIYVQVTPTLWFFSAGTSFQVNGSVGSRYYF